MGDKSVQKKQFIVESARQVFVDKGFKNVTMKDIVEACEISRGGLYLYFNNTKEVFLEVLRMEKEETDDVFSAAISENPTSADVLALFLQEQKREILDGKNQLMVATYEFYFEHKPPKPENFVRKQFNLAVRIIETLIQDGVEHGEFVCENPLAAARNIMYVLEGMKVLSQTKGITNEEVNKAVLYLMEGLVGE